MKLRACIKTLTTTLALLFIHPFYLEASSTVTAKDAWQTLVSKRGLKQPEFQFVENNPELPNVFIYGDSISIHYTQTVRELLKEKANVYRLFFNGQESKTFIPKMKKMLETMQDKNLQDPWSFSWDVIYFNVGLHDLKYMNRAAKILDVETGTQVSTIEEYKENLKEIISFLKGVAPDAALLFGTTTPVPPEGAPGFITGDAVKYNKAAMEVLNDFPEITVVDLYTFSKPNHKKWQLRPANVHYNDEGRAAQGAYVAKFIEAALDQRKTLKIRE